MIAITIILLAFIICATYIVCFGWGAASVALVALAITFSVAYATIQIVKTLKNKKK